MELTEDEDDTKLAPTTPPNPHPIACVVSLLIEK